MRFAIKLVKHVQGKVEISISKDIHKEKFLTYAEEILIKIERSYEKEDKEATSINFHSLINLAMKVPDIYILKQWYYALAVSAEYSKDYRNSLFYYGKLRSVAESIPNYKVCWVSFIRRASIYIKTKEYKYSLRMYKLLLKYSWLENNIETEIEAYKGMALWYYYQGFLKKSFLLYNRYINGK